MKKTILGCLVAASFASCGVPNGYHQIGTDFYSNDTDEDGHSKTIIACGMLEHHKHFTAPVLANNGKDTLYINQYFYSL